MGEPTRTPKRWHLPAILHASKLSTPANHNHTPIRENWHPAPTNPTTNPPNPIHLVDRNTIRSSTAHSIHSKSPTIRPTPLTAESPRRSSHRRLNTPRRPTAKARRIRNYTSHSIYRPTVQPPALPLPNPGPMRRPND